MFRRIRRILLALLVLIVGGCLHHYLPSHDIVRITGTDTKYVDTSGWFDTEAPGVVPDRSRDVRFINAVRPDGSVRVYRNEDTDWYFPWYFKFDSGDLQAEAQALRSDAENPVWAVVSHYGWRISVITKFPNAIAIRRATGPDELIIPWFNIFFLSGLAFLGFWIAYRIWRFKEERIDPVIDRIEDHIEDASEAVDRRTDAISGEASGLWARFQRWLDSWKPKERRR
ncbi:MAG TPA: DUF1523 family protein [Paracoccaceae bacterium]|nr:DUF1523 family protein [Paracoccaceae bacterium]